MYKAVVDFIRDTFNEKEKFIPLHAPVFIGNEKKYLCDCIDSTFVSSVGKYVDKFEEAVASFTGASKTVVCVNGTNALHLALLLVGVEEEDEVITQSLTFVATANAISYIGALPVFLDVDKETMGLSPLKVEEWLLENAEIRQDSCYNKKTGRRIKACVPMHTFGHPVHLTELSELCMKWNIELVEDAAESLGSYYKGKHTGTFGKIGVLSFNGNKTITTGGGGMLLFKDKSLGEYAKHLSTQSKRPHPWEFIHDHIGYNYRMPNINAALGCAQMEKLEYILKKKRKLAKLYSGFFTSIGIDFMNEPANCKSNYWLNAILLDNKSQRDDFLAYTNSEKIMTRPVWELMNRLPMYRNAQSGDLSNSEWLVDRVVNIPSSVYITPIP